MTQIFTIILAIAVAFSSMGGMAANVEESVSFNAKISVNADSLTALSVASGSEVNEETSKTMKVVGDILGALSLKGVATKDAAELDLLAGEDVALSIGVKAGENGTTVASNLLGGDVVFVSKELIEQYEREMMSAMSSQASGVNMSAMEAIQNIDQEQAAKDIEEALAKLTEAIEAKKGETEAGAFTVDELTFTGKTPVNMTYTEMAELLMTTAKELAAKESLKPVIEMSGKDIEAEIDKAISELKNQPEEELPVFEAAIYTDADNCAYYAADMTRAAKADGTAGEETLHLAFGEIESLNRVRVISSQDGQKADITAVSAKEGSMDVQAVIESATGNGEITAKKDEAGNMDLVADITSPTTTAKIVVKTEAAEGERTNFTLDLYMGGAEQATLSFSGSAGKGGEFTSAFEGEDVNVIPIETLMDENDQTASAQLQMKMIAGLLKGITVVTKNVPEDTADWINTQIKQMMSPDTTTESK